ncbi:hypothetical protein JAO71_05070 [Olleya sp. YSTF-M6]|uniref:Anti-sigma factor n=1 Tax=Olleya sediminilitoris TaxID=2795739 RepID=A0ABS1WJ72_9FLAO|nr:hypothetical protein [Olleya sediminilitoris]MBL7559170.1 hypothetical protein [Olleya sediminilitoris]
MAPNKFENHLKETLDRRTITPSKNAWSQLDSRLDNQQSKRKFPFWLLGLAATFTGVCLAVFLFNNNQVEPINVVIDLKKEKIEVPVKKINKKKIEVVNSGVTEKETKTKQEESTKIKPSKISSNNKKKTIAKVSVSTKKEKDNQLTTKASVSENDNNTAVANAITDSIKPNNTSSKPSVNNEAEVLLNKAYAEVRQNKNKFKSEKINANSLLEDIEMSSEKSLKNRLFHAVKSGYETLKTTVVERDY